jgi:hypothetical protein
VFDGEACSVRDIGGHATIPSEVANITKNLIGGGIFSLSGGMAIYSDNPAAVWSATLWIVGLGAIFGYFCLLVAKVRLIDREGMFPSTNPRASPTIFQLLLDVYPRSAK